ncbi:outer membrane beta-barrel protein [Acetobacter okinawensis]|uniref:outer membrane beta-barrel protein n=1 Tax=Acetobacter okinawensis TaxID=1076594 RepID=UPI001BA9EBA7|nr:outer membrane beta-barrel protein [Acetobacter okinawensis]MBS0988799.1 outer membrane beta-barrel protein [Acetobacter okinawensis]
MLFRRPLPVGMCLTLQLAALPALAQEKITPGDTARPLVLEETPAEKAQAAKDEVNLKPTAHHTWFDDLEGHLVVEAGVNGNPWTHTGRNWAQSYVDRANTATLNQITGTLSHPTTDIGGGYGIGFVFEVLYGSDARFNPTIGMGDGSLTGIYQWAPTQAHIDAHLPWLSKGGIDLQIGQQYGIQGFEGTDALERPFYSYNYSSDYIVPFETVGVLATWHMTDTVAWVMGVNAGNSTTFGGAKNNTRPKGYFGVQLTGLADGKLDVAAIAYLGPQQSVYAIGNEANHQMEYIGDFLATYKLNDTSSITLNGTYYHDDYLQDDVYGVTTYFSHDFSPSLTFNARGEIFRDNNGSVVGNNTSPMSYVNELRGRPYPYDSAPGTTYGELTVGVTYRPQFLKLPRGSFSIRPEVRLDKALNGTRPFNRVSPTDDPTVNYANNGTNNMFWFSCDAIWSY